MKFQAMWILKMNRLKNKRSFDFPKGMLVSKKYEIQAKLGDGWEGEVYRVREIDTDVERAAKFFYPRKTVNDGLIKDYIKKLHKLRACNALIKYIGKDDFYLEGVRIPYLLSDFIEGYTLDTYVSSWYNGEMEPFRALRLFYDIVRAVEEIHLNGEFHGDLHSDNIIIQKSSLHYDLKLIDVFHPKKGKTFSMEDDMVFLARLLYDMTGGKNNYKNLPLIIKNICCGLKRKLILKKFNNATALRVFIENSSWEDGLF